MTTIYQRLSPLGFAEWLEKKFPSMTYVIEWLQEQDKEPIDSYQRTSTNALAFRWLREEKGINNYIDMFKDYVADDNDPYEYQFHLFSTRYRFIYNSKSYDSHPLAEIAALEKAAEIIEQNK